MKKLRSLLTLAATFLGFAQSNEIPASKPLKKSKPKTQNSKLHVPKGCKVYVFNTPSKGAGGKIHIVALNHKNAFRKLKNLALKPYAKTKYKDMDEFNRLTAEEAQTRQQLQALHAQMFPPKQKPAAPPLSVAVATN